MSSPLLGPGWRYTEELPLIGEAEADEWEEDEVSYLVLDVGTHLPNDVLAQQNRVQLASLASATPFLRVGSRVYEGRYERMIGTEVIYSDAAETKDPPTLLGGTDHRINFDPVHLDPRDPKQDPASFEFPSFKPPAPRASRGRGRGRGRGAAATQTPGPEGTPAPVERGKRPRGRPRGSRARGRGVPPPAPPPPPPAET